MLSLHQLHVPLSLGRWVNKPYFRKLTISRFFSSTQFFHRTKNQCHWCSYIIKTSFTNIYIYIYNVSAVRVYSKYCTYPLYPETIARGRTYILLHSPARWLLGQLLISKKASKFCITSPLSRESNDDQWFFSHGVSYVEMGSMSWRLYEQDYCNTPTVGNAKARRYGWMTRRPLRFKIDD